jgi:hypothetical protein
MSNIYDGKSKLTTFSPSYQKRDTSFYIQEPKFNSLINICSELYEMENKQKVQVETVDNCLISAFNKSLNLNIETDNDLDCKNTLSVNKCLNQTNFCDCCYCHTSSRRSYIGTKSGNYLNEEYKGKFKFIFQKKF